MIWSGSFDDNKTAMSVIEGDKDTAEVSSIHTMTHANHFFHHTCINGMQCLFCH